MKPDLFENPLTGEVRDFTRQVWLAGLGAFARAQEEGGKVFEALVQEGQTIDAQMKKAASEKTEAVKGSLDVVKDKVEEMRDKATGGPIGAVPGSSLGGGRTRHERPRRNCSPGRHLQAEYRRHHQCRARTPGGGGIY
jgi:hypothetical protein